MRKRLRMIMLASLLAAGCQPADKKPDKLQAKLEGATVVFAADAQQLHTIKSEPVQTGKPAHLKITGRLVWDESRTVRIFPPFAGRVVQILARVGDQVRAGQMLAQLASPEFGQAQAEAKRAATDYALAQKNLDRLRELHAHGVAARKDLQSAEADFARAEAELQRAQQRVQLYSGSARVDQSLALASPIAGRVVERNINPGQELRSDLMLANAPPMFVITDPAHLWVQLDASESDLTYLQRGAALNLRASAYPDATFPAKVEAVADFIDPVTRVIKVRGSVDNAGHKLKAEMFVNAELDIGMEAGVRVPAKAVFLAGDSHYAFVEEAPGRYTRVVVKTGAGANGSVNVVSGLALGQKVVVEGSLLLQRMAKELAGE